MPKSRELTLSKIGSLVKTTRLMARSIPRAPLILPDAPTTIKAANNDVIWWQWLSAMAIPKCLDSL